MAHIHIDCKMSFAYMMALPQKIAFDGLKSGLASVNKEFSRLVKIANCGLGAAAVWQQRTFAVQLETLAKNSKWWQQMRLLGISFDEDKFRTDDGYRRDLLPLLLQKTSMDLLTAIDYVSDYNIEGRFLFRIKG